jgi:Arc/MetJ-type ribon-helix-helix transcriptional regulator
VAVTRKQRRTFMIEPDLVDRLRAIKERTGLSESEQIRQGIRWWLESREWPPRKSAADQAAGLTVASRARKRRRSRRE